VAVAVVDSKDAVVVLEEIVVVEVAVDELVAHVTKSLLHLLNRSSRASLANPLLLKLKQPNPLSRSRLCRNNSRKLPRHPNRRRRAGPAYLLNLHLPLLRRSLPQSPRLLPLLPSKLPLKRNLKRSYRLYLPPWQPRKFPKPKYLNYHLYHLMNLHKKHPLPSLSKLPQMISPKRTSSKSPMFQCHLPP
jgi:hypothetical protein